MKIILYLVFFSFFWLNLSAQKNEVNPNGYNIFYYPEKIKSSEGYMKDGKPVGIWKSFYPNGILKSIGKRDGDKLDSIWTFFDEKGFEAKKISYNKGLKNGYLYLYKLITDSLGTRNIVVSKELYLDDSKNGKSTYFDSNQKIEKTINYKNDRKDGEEIQFAEDGRIILILKYNQGNLTDSEKLNRYDNKNQKQGLWKEFHSNGKLKTYSYYTDGLLNGYYREYDEYGQLVKNLRYKNGIIQNEDVTTNAENIIVKEEKYDNGQTKFRGSFKNNVPVGTHSEYDENGNNISSIVFNENGIKESSGLIDSNGKKQGIWINYYPNGSKQSEGNYKNGFKEGIWIFYFQNQIIEEKGSYSKGKPSGEWNWYFENKNLRRNGFFVNGKENSLFYELNEFGDTLEIGKYSDGLKNGLWKLHVNDHLEVGEFKDDKQEGLWKFYYQNGQLAYEGLFSNGLEEGKHKYFYENGKLRETREYTAGTLTGTQKTYDENGVIQTVTEYQSGKKYKIDGKKVKTFKEE
jgi:antitoxin component YwqK of YwqJK toxin-antitoxin module